VVLIDFSGDFSRLSGREFAALLGKRRIGYLAVGVNFRCGYRLDTGARLLRDMMAEGGTLTELAPQLREGGAPVSSSRIREAVLAGDIAGAAGLLGRPYGVDLTGLCPIIKGDALSWDLGREGRVLPPAGRYNGLIRAGALEFPAEFSLDSGRLSFAGDLVLKGPGDFLNFPVLSVEFRPG
jgi:riboflavin kinase/FMN adenylyltransferase